MEARHSWQCDLTTVLPPDGSCGGPPEHDSGLLGGDGRLQDSNDISLGACINLDKRHVTIGNDLTVQDRVRETD
jgi:hypothetical protein